MDPADDLSARFDAGELLVRPMRTEDVAAADRVMRRAFGVYLGAADPDAFFGAANVVGSRFNASPATSFVAVAGDALVGSIQATLWGSFGFLGPLTVRSDLWDRGIARRLTEPVLELFDRSGTVLSALFTFSQSAKHVGLYQRAGYWPGYLTAIMSRPVDPVAPAPEARRFSELGPTDRQTMVTACARLTDRLFAGLDVSPELTSVFDQRLGETVVVDDDAGVAGFAVCHVGGGEADTGDCYVKFAATRPGPGAPGDFARLLDAVDALARDRGVTQVVAGVDTARRGAYRHLLDRGFRTGGQGIRMHRPDDLGYGRPDAFVIDDLR